MLRSGSLCSGYGGLDLAAQAVFGAEMAWHCEVDPAASRVLSERFPEVPNLGDITVVDWSKVPAVDVLTAGYPCQPFSYAGQRKGTSDARHLWPAVAEAIRVLRPSHVVLENVPGHLSLGFDTVLGDLAACGFDAEWAVLAAADVEAAHRRRRIFVYAWPAADSAGIGERKSADEENALSTGRNARSEPGRGGLSDRVRERESSQALSDSPDDGCQRPRSPRLGRPGSAHGDPSAAHAAGYGRDQGRSESARKQGRSDLAVRGPQDWGIYGPAVERWQSVLGRAPGSPTDENGRLSPRFVEWLMGLEDEWVTGLPGISRSAQLRILGNGVVPLQAESALSELVRRR